MEHKMWYDTVNEVVHLEFVSDFMTSDLEPIRQRLAELFEGKRYRQMIILISKTKKVENRETRELSNKVLMEAGVTDIAFVGGSAANRMVAKVLLKTGALKTKGNFFKNMEDGLNWILSKR